MTAGVPDDAPPEDVGGAAALRTSLESDSLAAARSLLGCRLLSDVPGADGRAARVIVRLTEVEAYGGADDPGSHAYRGRTRRNAAMFAAPGRLYVYFTYGMHWCVNVVCGPVDSPSAVLLRAGEVVEGAEVAAARRPASRRGVDLARGPARLAAALGITGVLDGIDLLDESSPVRLLSGAARMEPVRTGPRVGVSGPGGDGERFPWRLWVEGEPTVSTYRPGAPPRRRGPGGPEAPVEGPTVPDSR